MVKNLPAMQETLLWVSGRSLLDVRMMGTYRVLRGSGVNRDTQFFSACMFAVAEAFVLAVMAYD